MWQQRRCGTDTKLHGVDDAIGDGDAPHAGGDPQLHLLLHWLRRCGGGGGGGRCILAVVGERRGRRRRSSGRGSEEIGCGKGICKGKEGGGGKPEQFLLIFFFLIILRYMNEQLSHDDTWKLIPNLIMLNFSFLCRLVITWDPLLR